MAMDIDALTGNADWLPHRIKPNGAAIDLIHVPRATHRGITFLDDQYLGSPDVRTVPLEQLSVRPDVGSLHFIFHSAFCCSTLLTRALDIDGVAMGMNEPAILNQAAAMLREGRNVDPLLKAILPLLARPFGAGEAVIVKPSNVANVAIDRLMTLRPDARAILLYAPIGDFLASVAKKGMWGRIWMRKFHGLAMRNRSFDPGFSVAETFEQTDLQIAAMAWLQQQAQFDALLRRFPDRFRSLSSEQLLGDKAMALCRAGALMGLAIDGARAAAIASGPVFTSHAKAIGQDYDDSLRAEERQQMQVAHGEEIAMVAHWTRVIADRFGVSMSLPGALL